MHFFEPELRAVAMVTLTEQLLHFPTSVSKSVPVINMFLCLQEVWGEVALAFMLRNNKIF